MNNNLVYILFAVFIVSQPALSQTGTVKKTKGKKAVVVFDSADVPAGTVVSVTGASATSGAAVGAGALRPRKHGLAYRFLNDINKTTVSGSGISIESYKKKVETEISYTYNWSRFELGGYLGQGNNEEPDDKEKGQLIGVVGQLNFIENSEANSLIPYLRLRFSRSKAEISGGSAFSFSGTDTSLGVGGLWFPFSEIFAVDASYSSNSSSLSEGSSLKFKLKGAVSTIAIGWRIYF